MLINNIGVLDLHQPNEVLEVMYKITGAKTGEIIGPTGFSTIGYDTPGSATAALGQTTIDNLLSSTNEFVAATAFGATAMGTDAIGFVFNLGGQAKYTDEGYLEIIGNLGGTSFSDCVQIQTTALANTLAAPARLQVSSAGNVAGQYVLTGLDAATAGILVFRLGLKYK